MQQLADRAAGRPAPGAARRLDEILGLADVAARHAGTGTAGVAPGHGGAALDLPHGVRAQVTDGVLSFGRTPPLRGRDGI